jgi:hypothetical protein
MGLIFKDADNKPIDPKAARTRAMLLSLPFVLMGIFAIVLLLHDGLRGGLDRQHAMGLLSAAVVCGGLIALIFGISAKKQAMQTDIANTPDDKPWLARKDWAGGRIANSTRRAVGLLWTIIVFWCLASTLLTLALLPPQLQQGNQAALIVLLMPLIGLGGIFFAWNTTRAWLRFGRSVFQMAALPAAAGGALAGEVQLRGKLKPQDAWHLRLTCVRRSITGAANNRQTNEKILWQDEKWLRADLPQAERKHTRIPVYFKLPSNQPDSAVSSGDGIHWKLEAQARLLGPSFQAAFEVPVFKLAEPPAMAEDTTQGHEIPLEELWKKTGSRVQVRDLEDGKEFIFPPGRTPGFASGASAICLVWTAIIATLLLRHAPFPLLLVLSAMDLLMIMFVADLWFRRGHIVAGPKELKVVRAWFAFKQAEGFRTEQIQSIASDIGANAGHVAYYDLKLQTRDGKEVVLAKHLSSKPEADWLAQQITAALKKGG